MRQRWGQNFLVDNGVSRRIAEAAGVGPGDAVLEIGPGKGALTQFLIGKAAEVTLVELDRGLANGLRRRWGNTAGVTIEEADFLDWPLPVRQGSSLKVVSNLPYSAANAIIQKLLDWPAWTEAVVMVQKEVAVRIAARPGSRDYGVLSLAVQAKALAKALFDVGPKAFQPPPKVTSTVLRLTRLAEPRVKDERCFFRVVRAAFHQRRKTLLNSVSHGMEMEKPAVEAALKAAGIDPGARAETIDLEGYDRLSQLIGTSTQRM
jgi:16S rRNA (adenine1518-N6/adenine1519-N6)-dimethyltransferase